MTDDERGSFWVDDLYDMDEAQLRKEAERYARLARKYPQNDKPAYMFAYYRHKEAMELLEARSK